METISANVAYWSGGDKIPAYLCRPAETGRHPALIVVQEVWGLVDHIKDVASRFAREGLVGLAPDLYARIGQPKATSLQEYLAHASKLWDRDVIRDLSEALNYLRTLDFVRREKIGVIGFCMGGRYSLLMACHNKQLAACAVFYGRILNRAVNEQTPTHPIDLVRNIGCPILGIYGEADESIPLADVNRLRETLQREKKAFEIYTYRGAPHAFFNDTRESYRPEAAKDAWEKTITFFTKYLKG